MCLEYPPVCRGGLYEQPANNRFPKDTRPSTAKRRTAKGVLANHKYSLNQQNMMKIHKSLWGRGGVSWVRTFPAAISGC